MIWFFATCFCDKILLRRRRFSHKKSIADEAICRWEVSPRHVAAIKTTNSPSFFLRDSRASKTLALVKSPHARKARRGEKRGRVTRRFSPFSRGMIFARARVSLALQSLRENEGLLVVYCNLLPSVYRPIEIGTAQLRAITEITPKSAVYRE